MIKYLLSALIIIDAVLAMFLGATNVFAKGRKPIIKYSTLALSISSAVWSAGYGILILMRTSGAAYICRVIGLVGLMGYLILMLILVCDFTGIPKMQKYVLYAVAWVGLPIYFMVIRRNQMAFKMTELGMTYSFQSGIANTLYLIYASFVAIIIFYAIIYMIRNNTAKSVRMMGYRFIITETIILVGMIFDTILPLMGKAAIPGSTIFQFYGFVVFLYALIKIEKTYITIPNMSEFVYFSLSIPVIMLEPTGRIRLVNDAGKAFFDISMEELEADEKQMEQLFAVRNVDVIGFDEDKKVIVSRCLNNDAQCELQIDKVRDSYGDIIGYIILVQDITEKVEGIKRIEEARQVAENANRTKSVFLANMSHEIRTPMNAITGFSDLLLMHQLPEEDKRFVRDIRNAAHSLLSIINDILDVSKIESGKMELSNGNYRTEKLLQEVSFLMEPLANNKNLEFVTEFDETLPCLLHGDEGKLREVMINLVNNAIKYTEEGRVTFRVQCVSTIGMQAWLRFYIEDSGMGIPEDEKERIFESFAQVNKNVHEGIEGSGLGLAIVDGYVKMMGGHIEVESVLGEGSTFIVDVPQQIIDATYIGQQTKEERDVSTESNIGELRVKDVNVLVVDDNAVNLRVAENVMMCYGLNVELADSGQKAIDMCKETEYDIVFMDQMMPEMDGIEAMKRIRVLSDYYAESGDARIVALTANAVSGAREELLAEGFDEFLAKPIEMDALEDIITKYVPKEQIYYEQKQEQESIEVQDNAQISEVDMEKGVMQCGGNVDNYYKILAMFLTNGVKLKADVMNEFETHDMENYTIHVHAAKSLCYSIGADACGDKAKALELAGKQREEIYIQMHTGEFLESFQQLMEHVREFLLTKGLLEEEETEGSSSEGAFQYQLEQLKEAVEQFDFATCNQIIHELKNSELSDNEKEITSQLDEMVSIMDVDGMLKQINQLKEDK